MKRWPIRIRLTAGFAVVMVLVLAGAASTTVASFRASFRASFDESIDHTQAARLHALTTAGPVGFNQPDPGSLVGSDTAIQVLDSARGTVLAGPVQLDGRALLTRAEVATAARDGEQRQTSARFAGPVRIPAAPTPEGRMWRWWPPASPAATRPWPTCATSSRSRCPWCCWWPSPVRM